jgi:hypothetical protein
LAQALFGLDTLTSMHGHDEVPFRRRQRFHKAAFVAASPFTTQPLTAMMPRSDDDCASTMRRRRRGGDHVVGVVREMSDDGAALRGHDGPPG